MWCRVQEAKHCQGREGGQRLWVSPGMSVEQAREVRERRAGDGSRLLLACVLPPCWSVSHRLCTEVSLSHCPPHLPSGCDPFSSQRTWFTDSHPTNWSSLLGSRTWGFVHLLLISMHLLIQKLLTEQTVCAESCAGF